MTPKAMFQQPPPRPPRPPRTVRAGGEENDPFSMSTAFLLVGDPGTSKSIQAKILAGDVIDRGDPIVALDFSGGDELAHIEMRAARHPDYPVQVMDLRYTDSSKLRLKPLISTETSRLYYANKIFPDIKGDQSPYFNLNARDVFFTALCVLDHFGGESEDADAIRLCYAPRLLGHLADQIPHLGDPVRRFGDTKSAHDVMSTVRMRLAPMRPLAALALKCTKTIDIDNLKGATVIVVRDRDAVVMGRMASLFVDFVADMRLDTPRQDLLWVFLDELRQAEPLRSLSALLRRGRKCSTNVVMTMQSVNGVIDRYGAEVAKELFYLAGRVAALRVTCLDTARMLSERFGHVDSIIDIQPPPGEKSVRRENRERPNVTIDELRRTPLPDAKKDVLTGWFDGPSDTYRYTMPWLKDVTPPPGWKPRARVRRPATDEILPAFTTRDFERLNFPTDTNLMEFV